jgi:peptidoglycan/LPS O-acetylase OafA/YrhL
MWHTTSQDLGAASVRNFLLHRLIRIYLGYWPFLAIAFLLAYVANPADLATKDWFASLFLVEFRIQNLVLVVAWSLAFELYFYILFASLIYLTPLNRQRAVLLIAMVLLIANLFVFEYRRAQLISGELEPWSFFYSPFVLEFFAGVSLAALRPYWADPGVRSATWRLLAAIIVVMLGAWMGVENGGTRYIIWVRCVTFGVMALGLVASAVILQNMNVRWPLVLVYIGDSSYTLYLFHTLAIDQAIRWGLFANYTQSQHINAVAVCLVGTSIVLLAYILYRTVELPLYRYGLRQVQVAPS